MTKFASKIITSSNHDNLWKSYTWSQNLVIPELIFFHKQWSCFYLINMCDTKTMIQIYCPPPPPPPGTYNCPIIPEISIRHTLLMLHNVHTHWRSLVSLCLHPLKVTGFQLFPVFHYVRKSMHSIGVPFPHYTVSTSLGRALFHYTPSWECSFSHYTPSWGCSFSHYTPSWGCFFFPLYPIMRVFLLPLYPIMRVFLLPTIPHHEGVPSSHYTPSWGCSFSHYTPSWGCSFFPLCPIMRVFLLPTIPHHEGVSSSHYTPSWECFFFPLCPIMRVFLLPTMPKIDGLECPITPCPTRQSEMANTSPRHTPVLGKFTPFKIENFDIFFVTSFHCSLEFLYY